MNIFSQLMRFVIIALIVSTGFIGAQDRKPKTMVETSQIKNEIERDAFIDDCVREYANDKVIYDGKRLTLCKVPNDDERVRALILMVLSIVPLGISWLYGESPLIPNYLLHHSKYYERVTCALLGLLLFGYAITILHNESNFLKNNVPLITLTKRGLLFDGKRIAWHQIDQMKTITDTRGGPCFTTLSLCDEFLNSKITLKDINIRLPISVDALVAMINYYIWEDKKIKNKQSDHMASSETSTTDAFIKRFVTFAASTSVTYDGNALVVHNVPNKTEIAEAALFMTLATLMGWLSVLMATKGDSLGRVENCLYSGLLLLISTGVFIYYLRTIYENVTYGIYNIPLVTLTEKGILFGQKLVAWNVIKSIKNNIIESHSGKSITTKHTISLCDENDECILSLINIGDHIPVTTDNLIAVMNHFIAKAKQPEGGAN